MKYYNKDYENFVINQETETRIENQQQADEEIRKIEKTQKPYKSLVEIYRERHNGYPSYSVLFLSLFAAAIITFITTMVIGFTLIDLNIITSIYFDRILSRILPIWLLAIVILNFVILNYARRFFVKDDSLQRN